MNTELGRLLTVCYYFICLTASHLKTLCTINTTVTFYCSELAAGFLLYFSLRAKESVGQKTSTNHLRQPTVVIAQINVWLFVPSAAERCWLGLSGRTELITSVNNSLVFVLPDWLMPTTQSCKNFTGEAPSLYCTLQKVIVALQRIMWSCMKDYSYNRIYFMSISKTFVAHTYKL